MKQELLEKYEALVVEIATVYLDNMELELGRKYTDKGYEINAGLTEAQCADLQEGYNISSAEFNELYSEFQDMKPTEHLTMAMDAFTASGGSVEIEPHYDTSTQRLSVPIRFIIKDKVLDKIEGLSPAEDVVLKMNAMVQVDAVLSGSDSDASPPF